MNRGIIGILAVASALVLGAACEQNSSRSGAGPGSRSGTTSAPATPGPSGDMGSRSANDTTASRSTASSTTSSSDLSGTGGSGDAGMRHADAGTHAR